MVGFDKLLGGLGALDWKKTAVTIVLSAVANVIQDKLQEDKVRKIVIEELTDKNLIK